MRINLSRTARSQRLNAQDYNVYRSYGEFGKGGWIETPQSPPYFPMHGVVVPAGAKELRMVPEGDRPTAAMMFHSSVEIYTTRGGEEGEEGLSDTIEWRGEFYKVMNCNPYVDYGYWVAMGVRVKGS
jgi:hypothetical protein